VKQVLARVIENSEVMPGTYLVWVESGKVAEMAKPGQFVMVWCGEETLLRRPLSIHQKEGDRIALLVRVVAKGTHWLSQCKAGDGLDILGTLGNGFAIAPDSKDLLMVAGGIGIAPLCFLAQQALSKGCWVTLLLGAATASQLYPSHLIPGGVETVVATEDGTAGRKGMVTDILPDFAGGADQVFACGPMAMYRDMAANKGRLKLDGRAVQVSLEVRMGCGRGICYGCTLKTRRGLKQVCTDGPVFNMEDIVWEEPD